MSDRTLEVSNRYQDILDKSVKVEKGMSVNQFEPAPKHILVKVFPPDEQSAGGIVFPSQAQERKQYAVVISVARDVDAYAAGDVVLIDEMCGTKVKIGDDEYEVVMCDSEVGGNVLGRWPRSIIDNAADDG